MQFKLSFFTVVIFFNVLLPNFAQEPTLLRHGGSVQTVAFSPVDNSLVASAGDTHTIELWDLRNNTASTLRGHTGQISSIAFSPNGQLIASGSDDWTFRLWDVQTRQNIATLEQVTDRTRSQIKEVAFSPDGQLLATAGQHVKLWNVSTLTEIATFQHDEYVWALAFSPDGQQIAAGDGEGTIKIWNLQERQVISQLEGDTVRIDTLAFSPDGRTLASAGYQGVIKLWETLSDWTRLGTLQNPGTAYTLDFSPNGKALASTGHEAVTLWSVESGEEIAALTGHAGWIYGAAFSPNGKTLASSGNDGTVRIQNVETYLQTLQQREKVRLIYFLPINRSAQPDIDAKLDTQIKDVQQFYAEHMQNHGFGRKTFTFETDATGKAVVHHVNGRFSDAYYHNETVDKVIEEIGERFSLSTNLYLIFINTGSERIDIHWCGKGGIYGTIGGRAVVPASGNCFVGGIGIDNAGHELGHAFGLDHDFRNDAYLMSYGPDPDRLSYCAAEWLNVHRYFNTHDTSFNEPTTLEMLTPIALPPNTIQFRFEAVDADGLHQAQFIIPTAIGDPADGVKLHSCSTLASESSRLEFTTTELTLRATTEVTLRVIDVYGNFTQETYTIGANDVARVDVNGDGVLDVEDLVFVAAHFGTAAVRGAVPNPDANNDGFVNREDILLVVEALESQESTPAAPALIAKNLQRWMLEAKQHNLDDATFQRGIAVLEQLLVQGHPTQTSLLPNYPNPFNPETWIPYQLAQPADVVVSIYTAGGKLVRRLDLGYQSIGLYESRTRAAYWDGRNEVGEPVASGIYFYTLTAGNFAATRKMLILK